MNTRGLLNIQFAVKDKVVYTLEANPRASRTIPFVSKAVGISLAKIAAKVMVGQKIKEIVDDFAPMKKISHVAVKEVVFPFIKLPGVDPVLSPEMKSTGEVMGIDADFPMAYYKAQIAAGNELPLNGKVFISVKLADKPNILSIAERLYELDFEIISTGTTADFLEENGIKNRKIFKISEGSPNILDLMREKQIDLIINTPTLGRNPKKDGYMIRCSAVELNVPYVTTLSSAHAAVSAIEKARKKEVEVKSWNEYFQA